MVSRFLRDIAGSVLVESALIFPIFIVVALGTVDVTFMLYEWGLANKAAYMGARSAVVSNPVAANITSPGYTQTQLAQLGQPCFNSVTGIANGNCPSISTVCTPAASNGSCTNGYIWSEASFATILTEMQRVFPRLTRTNIQISYETNRLGYVAQSGGLPMNVTVKISCMTHQFFFIDALMGWAFSAPPQCPGPLLGPAIPSFASAMQSEDMTTN